MLHLTDEGPKPCSTTPDRCPIGGVHYASEQEAWAGFDAQNEAELAQSLQGASGRRGNSELNDGAFGADSFYGTRPPRDIQIDALNGVREALDEDDQTQLVAACGTGKTYMGRQLMNHEMEKEGANGVAIVLTSSIKLAEDTAAGMRPKTSGDDDSYDHAFGDYGDDYVVIEVHSDAKGYHGERSIRTKGAIDVEKLREQMEAAVADDKKLVIVSTYDSVKRVREAQELAGDSERLEADVLMHDEAHNILGQQTPTAVTDKNDAYTGFHNSIPGAVQARKRLYATATPVMSEFADDKPSTGDLEGAIETAKRMTRDPKERVTFYSSDTAIVGGVGGYISQADAIEAGCLAKPEYELREGRVRGVRSLSDAVGPDGQAVERTTGEQMTPQTYAAVASTLSAMAQDPEPGKNPVHNALAYCGSIDQSVAFRDNFRAVAKAEAGGMSAAEARDHVNSSDADLKRRARMALLAEEAEVLAAHSRTDGESVRERKAAFSMFKGHALTREEAESGWTPRKRVLANVDILSEGVSMSEIDTVVVSDDGKTSERAMTQAIGRSIRTVGGNDYKNTGHVIVPRVTNEKGEELNGGSVALAAYGATRVERGVAIRKLRDEAVKPDNSTKLRSYDHRGASTGAQNARTVASSHITSTADVVASAEMERVHRRLLADKENPNYNGLSTDEKQAVVLSTLREESQREATTPAAQKKARRLASVTAHLEGRSSGELTNMRKSSKVMNSQLAAGDVGALSPALSESLISGKVLSAAKQGSAEPTREEKLAVLSAHKTAVIGGLASQPPKATDRHAEARKIALGSTASTKEYRDIIKRAAQSRGTVEEPSAAAIFDKAAKDPKFVDTAYELVSKEEHRQSVPILSNAKPLVGSVGEAEAVGKKREAEAAARGESQYSLNRESTRKNGELNARTIARLADALWNDE